MVHLKKKKNFVIGLLQPMVGSNMDMEVNQQSGVYHTKKPHDFAFVTCIFGFTLYIYFTYA